LRLDRKFTPPAPLTLSRHGEGMQTHAIVLLGLVLKLTSLGP
jgi:hypothetical protein